MSATDVTPDTASPAKELLGQVAVAVVGGVTSAAVGVAAAKAATPSPASSEE